MTVKVSREDMMKCYARLFSTDDGKRVLDHLQITTFMRSCGPESGDTMLRHMDGQRALVQQIMRMVETGRG